LPVILYRPLAGARRATAAWLLKATSLPFVVAVEIGMELSELSPATDAAPVVAGLFR
jgi:hypothetical protein